MRVLVLFILVGASYANRIQNHGFSGYKLFALSPDSESQIKFLMKMNSLIDSYGIGEEVEFWTEPSMELLKIKGHILLMASPQKQRDILEALDEQKILYKTAIDDLKTAIEEESRMSPADQKAELNGEMTWTAYHRYQTIENYVKGLAADYPQLVDTQVIGKTYEGRNLYMLKIGNPRTDGKIKPAIWIDSHIHAREWIASATTTYMVNKMITEYATNSTCRRMLDEIDWYFLPVVNPDGVEHTHNGSANRMWRKTRQINPFSDCIGSDPNRNYDYKWMYAGSNQSPCTDLYAGPFPYSEVENLALTDAVMAHKEQIKVLLTVHSAAQMWLVPWGYAVEYPDDFNDLMSMARRANEALFSQYHVRFQVDNSAVLLGATAGSTDDWGKAKAGIKYAFTLELRDRGQYGFLLPPHLIIPSGIETFEALNVLAQIVFQEFGPTLN